MKKNGISGGRKEQPSSQSGNYALKNIKTLETPQKKTSES
jgi:hypothetical protein